MHTPIRHMLALSIAAALFVPPAFAQYDAATVNTPYAVAATAYSQQELDAMLAPIALYPDGLLTQILMAATYPLEVVEAARWSRAIPGLDPQQAVQSVARRGWDPSVQSLMAFPQVLALMDSSLEWTQRLGNAFLGQQAQVWSTVQALRQRAYAAGQLRSSDQFRVLHDGGLILLEPVNPEVVYVPYYDPLQVYGGWWWPDYAPMRWSPWPGYVARPGLGSGYYAGSGIRIGLNFFFGHVDWEHRRAVVLPPQRSEHRGRDDERGREWQHDPQHRGNVPYVAPRAPNRDVQPERRPERPERPEFRGQMPNPAVQVAPPATRQPTEQDSRERRNPPVQTAPIAAPAHESAVESREHRSTPTQAVPTAPTPNAAALGDRRNPAAPGWAGNPRESSTPITDRRNPSGPVTPAPASQSPEKPAATEATRGAAPAAAKPVAPAAHPTETRAPAAAPANPAPSGGERPVSRHAPEDSKASPKPADESRASPPERGEEKDRGRGNRPSGPAP